MLSFYFEPFVQCLERKTPPLREKQGRSPSTPESPEGVVGFVFCLKMNISTDKTQHPFGSSRADSPQYSRYS
eukprot:6492549-Amphidinium_carterae.3